MIDKRKVVTVLFWWGLLIITGFLIFSVYQLYHPLPKQETITSYKYKTIETQSDLSAIQMGTSVKYGSMNLCVSSVQSYNIKSYHGELSDPLVIINLRPEGDCK